MAKKEAEGEAESECKTKKKPVKREDGKLIKESEDMEEEEAEETAEEKKKKKMRMKEAEGESEDEDEEEEEEEAEVEKDQFGGKTPEEEAIQSNTAGHTVSPNAKVPSTQNVFTPASQVSVGRSASSGSIAGGQSPSEVTYGKSAKTDLLKSPLFVELSGQIEALQKSFEKKLESIEKSVNDRVANLQKTAGNLEKFYNQSFYKAVDENVAPEGVMKKSIKEQIDTGKARYSF